MEPMSTPLSVSAINGNLLTNGFIQNQTVPLEPLIEMLHLETLTFLVLLNTEIFSPDFLQTLQSGLNKGRRQVQQ